MSFKTSTGKVGTEHFQSESQICRTWLNIWTINMSIIKGSRSRVYFFPWGIQNWLRWAVFVGLKVAAHDACRHILRPYRASSKPINIWRHAVRAARWFSRHWSPEGARFPFKDCMENILDPNRLFRPALWILSMLNLLVNGTDSGTPWTSPLQGFF